jgi:hypothetical protein
MNVAAEWWRLLKNMPMGLATESELAKASETALVAGAASHIASWVGVLEGLAVAATGEADRLFGYFRGVKNKGIVMAFVDNKISVLKWMCVLR